MPDLFDLAANGGTEEEGESLAKALAQILKIMALAKENGWTENPFFSLALRLKHPDGVPIYAVWGINGVTPTGRPSVRFRSAQGANGQFMTLDDLKEVLVNPELILPEPPANLEEEVNGNDCNDY
ncbi:hypothetical protein EAS64_33685 [Trebonia kvetii]|uniref:Uncharacterized protein n=1 Tax=Trebonia kvetii TaxID=2480626 RepID=A0A6P2BVJ3_9ACTN|nr:hypothetical protein [Trebonia kvetii]TVZ01233.1 hypothetical protein EAS64_33685 [Trebonia kvetii]